MKTYYLQVRVRGGMFRSTDGGMSWSMTTHPNQLHNVTCVSQDTRPGKKTLVFWLR